MSDSRQGTWWLSERTFLGAKKRGGFGTVPLDWLGAVKRKVGQTMWQQKRGEMGHLLTFSTNADFKHPGAETVSSWHAEALISGVVFGAHEDVTGRCEAVRLDAFDLHVFHIGQMDRPKETEQAKGLIKGNMK